MPELDSAAVAATYQGGMSLKGTAEAFSTPGHPVSLHQVRKTLAKEGVPVRTVAEAVQLRAQQKLGHTSAVDDYKAGGPVNGLANVADRYGVDAGLLRVWLGMHGVTIRDRAAAGKARVAGLDIAARRAMVAKANAAAAGHTATFQQRCNRAASRQGRPGIVIRHAHHDLMAFLKKHGRPTVMEQAIGPYNLAVGIGSRVAVEVTIRSSVRPLHGQDRLNRLQYLLGEGWDILHLRVISSDFDIPPGGKTRILEWAAWRDAHPDAPPRWAVLHRDGHILHEGTEGDLPTADGPPAMTQAR